MQANISTIIGKYKCKFYKASNSWPRIGQNFKVDQLKSQVEAKVPKSKQSFQIFFRRNICNVPRLRAKLIPNDIRQYQRTSEGHNGSFQLFMNQN